MAHISSPARILTWKNNKLQKYKGDFIIADLNEHGLCSLVNKLPLEDYLITLLPKEMNGNWPLQALKTQAVVARTYALYKIRERKRKKKHMINLHFDLENSEKYQVNGHLLEGTRKSVQATRETSGEILVNKKGELVISFFHSKCGGHTYLPKEIWGGEIEGYQVINCPFCSKYGPREWKYFVNERKFKILFKGEKIVDKRKIWKILGRKKILSSNFNFKVSKKGIEIKGKGAGHGVGLCQYGSLELARRGWNYRKILKYYFPNFEIQKNYGLK